MRRDRPLAVDHIKYLPPGTLPEGGVPVWSVGGDGSTTRSVTGGSIAAWSVADAERWRRAGVPTVLAPVLGGWILAALVVTAYVLLFGVSAASGAWRDGSGAGTDWLRYPGVVLLTALPLWYRYVPVAVFPAALFVAVEAALVAGRTDGIDRPATAGHLVVLAVCAIAVTGGGLRLWARRRQRALVLAAAGRRRFPLPGGVPESDGHRGHAQVYLGLVLCLLGLAILTDGLVEDLTSGGVPYDAIGQQRVCLVLLVAGTTFGGWGQLAYRAARRLHEEDQPALIVGVRAGADGRHWVCADARTPSAPPLIAYVPRGRDTRSRTRLLGSGSVYAEGNGHHDIDPRREPFEAILYGTPTEGDEVVLAYACATFDLYQDLGRMYAAVTTVLLRPDRHHRLGVWEPVDGATRQRERLREGRERAERQRAERERAADERARREAEERRRKPPRPSSGRSRGRGTSSSHYSSCGSSGGPSCGSSCGSSCGGCGGD